MQHEARPTPKMAHGDADRMAEFLATVGLPLVPWQRDFLNRWESASMDEQFGEIVRGMGRPAWFGSRSHPRQG